MGFVHIYTMVVGSFSKKFSLKVHEDKISLVIVNVLFN